jgi:hypothetical protein
MAMVLLIDSLVYAAANPGAFPYLALIPSITIDRVSEGSAFPKEIRPRRTKGVTIRRYLKFKMAPFS